MLPGLKKLDNVEVTQEEVDEAMRTSLRMVPPQQQQQGYDDQTHGSQPDWQESSPVREVSSISIPVTFYVSTLNFL